MDGVSMGIIRLQDTYKFNTTELVGRGVFQTDDVSTQDESQGLTVWDAFKIGVKGTNRCRVRENLKDVTDMLQR